MYGLLICMYLYFGFRWVWGDFFHRTSWLAIFANILFWPVFVGEEIILYLKVKKDNDIKEEL